MDTTHTDTPTPVEFTCVVCLDKRTEVDPHTRNGRTWCAPCAGERRAAIDAVTSARRRLTAAQTELVDASAAYRDAVAAMRAAYPSERSMARALGLSQTAVRDLLRTDRRDGR